jgi:hypothetical protein
LFWLTVSEASVHDPLALILWVHDSITGRERETEREREGERKREREEHSSRLLTLWQLESKDREIGREWFPTSPASAHC